MALDLRGLAGTCNAETKDELLALAKDCDQLARDREVSEPSQPARVPANC
jgi:hypothetical protein